jgi:uncharacterized protein YegJ (DUF2314 family)
VARETDGLPWDEDTRQLFAPASWRTYRVDGFIEGRPKVQGHMVVHQYQEGSYVRLVSLGMEKLGLPDLAIEKTTESQADRLLLIMNGAAAALVRDGALAHAGTLEVEREGKRVSVKLVEGKPREGDAENRLMELVFAGPGVGEQEGQAAATAALLGAPEDKRLTAAASDRELNAASERARAKLPEIRARFLQGLPPGERLAIKAPFQTRRGGTEWMWVEVREWKGERLDGILINEPFDIPTLKSGARVEVKMSAIFDYTLEHADGSEEGGETTKILLTREAKR